MKKSNKPTLQDWWDKAKEKSNPEDIVNYLQNNKEKLEESFSELDSKKWLYNTFNRLFSIFSMLAEIADKISEAVQGFLMKYLGFQDFITSVRNWKNQLNFKELVEFGRAKLYSLRHAPQNEKLIKTFAEIFEFASKHGLDLSQQLPQAPRKLKEMKEHLFQHKFSHEFSKSRMEQLLAVKFAFDRSIYPVLPDSAFWHRFFEFFERQMIVDIILVNHDNRLHSFKYSAPRIIESTDVIQILRRAMQIKNKGHRIFFVGHHEGYLGPYFVRSVIRKLGFDELTKNCNTVVGPRMFSNLVLRNGAANVGNLFVTVPSQKTTVIKTTGLAEELQKTARRTQCLIKLPDACLYLIKKLDFNEFKSVINDSQLLEQHSGFIGEDEKEALKKFLADNQVSQIMQDTREEDYELFKKNMRECFLLFPEGSRSLIDSDGTVSIKYVNPRYLEAYMRPGDFIVPINLVGGSDIAKGWRLRPAKLGLSLEEPFEVTETMIENYTTEGLEVMRKISALPNIKAVRFNKSLYQGDQPAP